MERASDAGKAFILVFVRSWDFFGELDKVRLLGEPVVEREADSKEKEQQFIAVRNFDARINHRGVEKERIHTNIL